MRGASEALGALGRLRVGEPVGARARPGRTVLRQLYGCTILWMCGSVLGAAALLRELAYHARPPGRAGVYVGVALCAGIVLGLWLPRSLIRRRLARAAGVTSEPPAADDQEMRFAASLTGVLILALGLLWVLSCGGAAMLEEYRRFLTHRFVFPASLTRGLLWGPAVIGLLLIGGLTTTTLIAVHGWHRLVTTPRTKVAELWAVILGAGVVGGVIVSRVETWGALALLAPLLVFLGGALSVFRETSATSAYVQSPPRACAAAEALSLLLAAAAAVATASGMLPALSANALEAGALGGAGAVLAFALLAGLAFARILQNWSVSAQVAPLILLASGVALLLPYHRLPSGALDPVQIRLAVAGFCAAACVVLVGRRVGRASGSVQYALSWVGAAVAAGVGLALIGGAALADRFGTAMLLVVGALAALAVAGLVLILDTRLRFALRAVGLAGIGLSLLLLPQATRTPAHVEGQSLRSGVGVSESPATQAGRGLLTAARLRTARVLMDGPAVDGVYQDAWSVDLAGASWDTVLIERSARRAAEAPAHASVRRLLRRCVAALARGGRLVIELPPDAGSETASVWLRAARPVFGASSYRLVVCRGEDVYEALVLGPDVSAWIAEQPLPDGFEVSLEPSVRLAGVR